MNTLDTEIKEPLLSPIDSKGAKKPPEQIVLVFLHPNKEKLFIHDTNSLQNLKNKHPDAEIIYVDKNDFSEDDKLKPECKHKYAALQYATVNTKIKILAHGTSSEQKNSNIYSDSGAYPEPEPRSQCKKLLQPYCGLFFPQKSTAFSAHLVANLIKEIPDPTIYKSADELASMQSLPIEHLRISVQSCFGQRFANHLYRDLSTKDNHGKMLLCSITTGDKNLLLVTSYHGKTRYDHSLSYALQKSTEGLANIGLYTSAAICAGAAFKEKEALMDDAVIALIVFSSILFALGLYAKLQPLGSGGSHRADKVVLVPDFEELRKAESNSIPYKTLTKEEFLHIYEPERMAKEKDLEDFDSRILQTQYGSLV